MFLKEKEVLDIFDKVAVPITQAHLSEISSDGKTVESQSEAGGLDNVGFLAELFIQSSSDALLVLHRKDWVEIRLKKTNGQISCQIIVSEFHEGVRREKEVVNKEDY